VPAVLGSSGPYGYAPPHNLSNSSMGMAATVKKEISVSLFTQEF
jgi:hypothetical protein